MLARCMIAAAIAIAAGAVSFAFAQQDAAPAEPEQSATAAPAVQAPAAPAPAAAAAAPQAGPGDPAAASDENGKAYDADGDPTFTIAADGTVDWFSYSGFRRYHSECHVCHGPDGEGSSYAPRLVDSVQRISYAEFVEVVSSGRMNVAGGTQSVMPAFGTNLNVMCYIDDMYVYLRARAQGGLARGRPPKRADKPPTAAEDEQACLGT